MFLMKNNDAQISTSTGFKILGFLNNPIQRIRIKRKTALLISFLMLLVLILTFITILAYQKFKTSKYPEPTNFWECSKVKNSIIQESYPAVCITKEGKRFTQELSDEEKKNIIPPELPNVKGVCEDANGKWLENYHECEGIEEEECKNSGGSYDDCSSACRHDPSATNCITLCVRVCKY
jgi:hypothetical protein